MSYRFMRMLLMFDLPMLTPEDRRTYRQFRKYLLSEGFLMHQYSVYSKLLLNDTANKAMIKRLEKHNPKRGNVTLLTVTEKQFSRMTYLYGEKSEAIANTDSRIVILGDDGND